MKQSIPTNSTDGGRKSDGSAKQLENADSSRRTSSESGKNMAVSSLKHSKKQFRPRV
jgi:hypothetical protein